MNKLLASLTLFTRLPWYRLREIPGNAFSHAVDFWPWVGVLTGGVMALVFYTGIHVLPLSLVLILTIVSRLLLTGALHEDGLADFCDGMGGGTTREKALQIMKDSHIGTYGVLGLVVYFALLYNTLNELTLSYFNLSLTQLTTSSVVVGSDGATGTNPILMLCATIWFTDVWCKSIASFITYLPYARKEEEAKVKVVYHTPSRTDTLWHVLRILIALAVPFFLMKQSGIMPNLLALLLPIVCFLLLIVWMKRKLGGYTGDCCGATFLICELVFLLAQMATCAA